MQNRRPLCLAFALSIVLGASPPSMAEGRPPKFRLEKEATEKKLLETRRSEERVTRVEQIGKEIDLTKRTNEKTLSASELLSKFDAQKNRSSVERYQKIEKTLDRISKGLRDPHYNDGSPFKNREKLLPEKPEGYYKEYVVRDAASSRVGLERIVVGKSGEVFYTSDHYVSFSRER